MTDLAMTNYKYARIHLFMLLPTSADPKMLIKTLSPTVIRIEHFYYCWIRINKANTVHVSNH